MEVKLDTPEGVATVRWWINLDLPVQLLSTYDGRWVDLQNGSAWCAWKVYLKRGEIAPYDAARSFRLRPDGT